MDEDSTGGQKGERARAGCNGGTARKERRVRCVAGGERGEKKNEEAMGEGAHVLLAAAIMISCGHQDGTCQAVSLSRQGQRAPLPRL